MGYLLITSLLWAFSFGLVKGQLIGLDAIAISVIRMVLALAVFLPFLRLRSVKPKLAFRLMAIGTLQFGLMYILYLMAFQFLQAFEVALYTCLTPLYVVLADAALERRWHMGYLLAATLAALGASVVLHLQTMSDYQWLGFLLIQGANFCFAAGQLLWKRSHKEIDELKLKDYQLFALPYLGASIFSVLASLWLTDWSTFRPNNLQLIIIIHLGVLASGLCFFWWNKGVQKVNAGTLAVMNNAKLPMAIAISLLIFGEKTDITRLLLGGGVMLLGIWVAERSQRKATSAKS